jgi:hypothetical protein
MANSLKAKDETVNLLRGRNFLKHVQDLNFNGWHKLTSPGLEVEQHDNHSFQRDAGHRQVSVERDQDVQFGVP